MQSVSKAWCFSVESRSDEAGARTGAPRPSPSAAPAHRSYGLKSRGGRATSVAKPENHRNKRPIDMPKCSQIMRVGQKAGNFGNNAVQNICAFLSKVDRNALAPARERCDPYEPPRLHTTFLCHGRFQEGP